jgi:hypothetical protein
MNRHQLRAVRGPVVMALAIYAFRPQPRVAQR